jgi:hypothetical protein
MTTPAALRFLPLALAGFSVLAQAPAPEPSGTSGIEAKSELIVHHDRGSRVEELRVGGQTRSIQVDTNSQVPGYQIQPIDPAQSTQYKGAAGKSSWRVIKF